MSAISNSSSTLASTYLSPSLELEGLPLDFHIALYGSRYRGTAVHEAIVQAMTTGSITELKALLRSYSPELKIIAVNQATDSPDTQMKYSPIDFALFILLQVPTSLCVMHPIENLPEFTRRVEIVAAVVDLLIEEGSEMQFNGHHCALDSFFQNVYKFDIPDSLANPLFQKLIDLIARLPHERAAKLISGRGVNSTVGLAAKCGTSEQLQTLIELEKRVLFPEQRTDLAVVFNYLLADINTSLNPSYPPIFNPNSFGLYIHLKKDFLRALRHLTMLAPYRSLESFTAADRVVFVDQLKKYLAKKQNPLNEQIKEQAIKLIRACAFHEKEQALFARARARGQV